MTPHEKILRGRICAALFLVLGTSPASAQPNRIERIERLLGEVRVELDSLKRESVIVPPPAKAPASPIMGELLSDRQRRLARAAQTGMRSAAAGYVFNTDLPVGMNALYWADPWGARIEGGLILGELDAVAGLALTGLYSINRFVALDLLETHLYALAGTGYYWERIGEGDYLSGIWYSIPDKWVRGQLGVGTEFTFFGLGGIRLAPETGLRAARYLSRHERSPEYAGSVPESDFDLTPFFAFNISFYFR